MADSPFARNLSYTKGRIFLAGVTRAPDVDLDGLTATLGAFAELGYVPAFELMPKTDLIEHSSDWGSGSVKDLNLVDLVGLDGEMTLEEVDNVSLSLIGYGDPQSVTVGSFSGKYFARPSGANYIKMDSAASGLPNPGDRLRIALDLNASTDDGKFYSFLDTTGIIVTDNIGTQLTNGVNYRIPEGGWLKGEFEFIDLTTGGVFQPPLKVAFRAGQKLDKLYRQNIQFGKWMALSHQRITGVIVSDSKPSSVTLISPMLYDVEASFGRIRFNNQAAMDALNLVYPLQILYTFKPTVSLALMSSDPIYRAIRFEGINRATNELMMVELWNCLILPPASIPIQSDGKKVASFKLRFSAQADMSKPSSGLMGQYGRMVKIPRG